MRRLRGLDLEAGSSEGGKSFIAAASGLIHTGHSLCVIADDALDLAVFPGEGEAPGRLARLLPGEAPADESERKSRKPDFEALTLLPAFEGAPDGALLALESGSKSSRERGAVIVLSAEGALDARARVLDVAPLYEALRRDELPELNIEGAPVSAGRMFLMQRGNGPSAVNATVELSLEGVLAAMAAQRPLDESLMVEVVHHDLGDVDGVRLCFSDAAPLDDRRLVYMAAAEGDDGSFAGAVIGIIEADGRLGRQESLEPPVKVEGVALAPDGAGQLLLVADGDDPDSPAPLLAASLDDYA